MKKALLSLLLATLSYKALAEFDKLGRLINYPGKIEVECPKQDKDVGVILVIGQSNSANHAQKRFHTRYPSQVYNFYDGKCYVAASPLLGATGDEGEFMTPFADYLIDWKVYKKVVLIASGMNGTKISYWKKGAYLNNMLIDVLDNAKQTYHLTEVIWHQGESDTLGNTAPQEYKKSFKSLVETLRNKEINIPIYYAIATRCSPIWDRYNPIANMQRTLIDEGNNIYLGADTDLMIGNNERFNFCHFLEGGQIKAAYSFAYALNVNHAKGSH